MSAMEAYELRAQGVPAPELYEPGSCAQCQYWREAPTGGIGVCCIDSDVNPAWRIANVSWTYPTDGEGCEVEA